MGQERPARLHCHRRPGRPCQVLVLVSQREAFLFATIGFLVLTSAIHNRNGKTLECQHRLLGHKLGVLSVDIDASGTRAVSSSMDSQIKVWDLETGQLIRTIDPGASTFTRADFDGERTRPYRSTVSCTILHASQHLDSGNLKRRQLCGRRQQYWRCAFFSFYSATHEFRRDVFNTSFPFFFFYPSPSSDSPL